MCNLSYCGSAMVVAGGMKTSQPKLLKLNSRHNNVEYNTQEIQAKQNNIQHQTGTLQVEHSNVQRQAEAI